MKLKFYIIIISGIILFTIILPSRNRLCEFRFKMIIAEISAVMAYESRQ